MISIGGSNYEVQRARFRTFLFLQDIQEKIEKAEEPDEQSDLICLYVSTGLGISKDIVSSQPWKDAAMAYVAILTANVLRLDLAFMKTKITDSKVPWDYAGRDWYSFAHIFAKQYSWPLEYIADLDVEDALHLIQEILVEEQLQREWEWDLSEKSTGYDPTTKKSKHIELPRPPWMVVVPEPPKPVKIHKDLLPQGLVVRMDGSHVTYE